MSNTLILDFETQSDRNINDGYLNYLQTPNSHVLCCAYKINDQPIKLWTPKQSYPFKGIEFDRIYAHNAQFEYMVWNYKCVKSYGWPEVELDKFIDTMAICGRFTYYLGLDKVGSLLNLPIQKMKQGKALIKACCTPPFDATPKQYRQLGIYCAQDVEVEALLIKELPADHLSETEQEYWKDTVKVNMNGVPIDINSVVQIHDTVRRFVKSKRKDIPALTNGMVTKVTQVAKILKYLKLEGYPIDNLQASTVEAMLKQDLPPDVKEILKLRQELSQSSTAKYKKILQQYHKPTGRVYDNLMYHKASTGRYAGKGFQAHNLPRYKVADPEAEIKKFFNYDIWHEDVLTSAKALIRPIIKAPKGMVFIVVDYKSIENIALLWAAGQSDLVKKFNEGLDLYKVMASSLYHKKYNEIDKHERFLGKTLELGSGYGLGWRGFLKYADGFGIKDMEDSDAQYSIDTYRATHDKVVKFWWGVKRAALSAVWGKPSFFRETSFKKVSDRNGRKWLQCILPSGRALYYSNPEVREDKFGEIVTHMGIDSYTQKWRRLRLTPGRITENIIQAICRDLLAQAVNVLLKHGFKVILHVHDEIVVETFEDHAQESFDAVSTIMELPYSWTEGLPIKTEGYIAKRYRKD